MHVTTIKISDIGTDMVLARHYLFNLADTTRTEAAMDVLIMTNKDFETATIIDNTTHILPNSGLVTGCCLFQITKRAEAIRWWNRLGYGLPRYKYLRNTEYEGRDFLTLTGREIEDIWMRYDIISLYLSGL